MSSPKDIRPRPRYSMQVFDGKLNRVFQLQSRLKQFCSEVEALRVSDSNLGIVFDCRDELLKLKKKNDDALKLMIFDLEGTFGQETHDRLEAEIDSKISALQKQLDACESVKARFMAKKLDYESYCSYLVFHKNSRDSLEDFKSNVTHYLRSNLEARLPDVFDDANRRINEVIFKKEVAPFAFGFNLKSDVQKQGIIEYVADREAEIQHIRNEISTRVLEIGKSETFGKSETPRSTIATIGGGTAPVIDKITKLIRHCDDPNARRTYSENLQRLMKSKSLKDIYFFKELHDSILETEKVRRLKNEITSILSELNGRRVHKTLEVEKGNIVRLCLNLLGLSSIRNSEVDAIRLRFGEMEKRSKDCFEEDEITQKEHLFLKSQIVRCLENLGYEVMDDMEVIDFEKEGDFLLKVHDQENYLNLKFKDDGSIRYVFQIPENPSELATDKQNLKLHEMKVTCDEFKSVLRDLSKIGLQIDLRSERSIGPDSLISVPDGKRHKLKSKVAARQHAAAAPKRYLDR